MNRTTAQVLVAVTTAATLVVNYLSNALPFNGRTAAEVSSGFQSYFIPAGYVFAIWGVIYLGLAAFAIYQALPAGRHNPRLRRVHGWVVLTNLANTAWLFLWHYERFPWTLLPMGVLLASLIAIYLELKAGGARPPASRWERWVVDAPFSLYLGWITVAAIANASVVLEYTDWNRFGFSDAVWMGVMLGVVVAFAWAASLREKDGVYISVLLWALAGIGARFPAEGGVTVATWGAFALVLLALASTAVGARTHHPPPSARG